jgi:hypothetical protein
MLHQQGAYQNIQKVNAMNTIGDYGMKERPILMNAAMVRAVLDGGKMQTRRVWKLPNWAEWDLIEGGEEKGNLVPKDQKNRGWYSVDEVACPYGQVGDRLWVRESGWQRMKASGTFNAYYYSASVSDKEREYLNSYPQSFKRRPSIHMPRWASRITLEITNVRVERLLDISEADAIAEGIQRTPLGNLITFVVPGTPIEKLGARAAYWALWNLINGPASSDKNPWVWVIEFKQLTTKETL